MNLKLEQDKVYLMYIPKQLKNLITYHSELKELQNLTYKSM